MKKRGFTRKRVSNAKLLASGWKMLYPDFRAGYSAIIESGRASPREAPVSFFKPDK